MITCLWAAGGARATGWAEELMTIAPGGAVWPTWSCTYWIAG